MTDTFYAFGPEPLPALVLSASLPRDKALSRIRESSASHLVVRRVEGLVVFWYVLSMEWASACLASAAPGDTLRKVLDLHENGAAPVCSPGAGTPNSVLGRDAVVLDGERFVGVRLATLPTAGPAAAGDITGAGASPADLSPQGQHSSRPVPRFSPPRATTSSGRRTVRDARPALETLSNAIPTSSAKPSGSSEDQLAVAPQPFSAFPRIEAPQRVEPEVSFTVTVGLAKTRQSGINGGPVQVALPDSLTKFELEVQLVVDGFDAPQGLRAKLPVDRDAPDRDCIRFALVAPKLAGDEEARLSMLRVLYFHDGQYCGNAARHIAVVPANRQPLDYAQGSGEVWTQSPDECNAVLSVMPGMPAVDLTIAIDKLDGGERGDSRYVWSFCSPLTDTLPSATLAIDIGVGGAELGGKIISEIQTGDALGMSELLITGLGRSIRDAAPVELWQALRIVHQALEATGAGRLPNVLLLTAEPHVPWELALLEDAERLAPDAPPLLGCQVNLGRWPLGRNQPAPRGAIQVRHMAAVVGDYAARSGWRKLDKAAEEGRELVNRYQALELEADTAQVKQLLMAKLGAVAPGHGAEAVHFACHGDAALSHVLDAAIILGNGARLSPVYLANTPLGKVSAPFLFMNACQVGKAGELLASFSGFAGEAIRGGFRGFLGPLWSVEDALARDIALGFYEQAFGDAGRSPRPVAAVLREMRARFSDAEPHSLTRLAYVFYGHPGLTLTRVPRPAPGPASSLSLESQS